ncbi:BaiN/RdsA family NAD(P)/FAD-dependent oxidoreductase [Clostridium senegalense]|uniref:NAD(P)/FAD-dependent oxidoreductase n=1 Tax=Clostridium senegalense TaxID=1465809 RepID=UPI001C1277E9|nr:NAD(P)/FAD-dependent oxidoreductase [Clostridium senegalense]MBU5225221.1 NAD(P)/FAD-dependent oxidoreductase [Clostridium senegalense]
MSKVVIVGGGPAGMMAAISAAKCNKVLLIEKNEKIGKKLFITGKGRCNVTNAKDIGEFINHIPTNPYFLYSSLYSFTNEDTMNFFESKGTKLKIERGDRVFPVSDKSSDIIKTLENELRNSNVEIMLNSNVEKFVLDNNKITELILSNGKKIYGDHFIICGGGASYPQTGSDGTILEEIRKIGHNIIALKPSLVPIELSDDFIKDLQGLSLKNVELIIKNNKNKVVFKELGEMLFTHFGISGPLVLSASSNIKENEKYKIAINFKPALTVEELDKRVQKDFKENLNRDFKNSLDGLFPKKLIPIMVQLSGIDENKKVNAITKEERKKFVDLIHDFNLTYKGLRPVSEAIVTAGGIDTKEIDPSTMKSKIIENLSFAGEIIDVDAYTGGYNVQIAFSTGYLAGMKVSE